MISHSYVWLPEGNHLNPNTSLRDKQVSTQTIDWQFIRISAQMGLETAQGRGTPQMVQKMSYSTTNHGSWGVFNIREKGLNISEIGYIYVLNLVLHSTLYLVYGKTLRNKYVWK